MKKWYSQPLLLIGWAGLLLALGASMVLVIHHFGHIGLPGCGAGGGCAKAQQSIFGKVPGLNWPVSFVGLAYFASLFICWITGSRSAFGSKFKMLIILGVLLSLFFIGVMGWHHYMCMYCLLCHLGNLLFSFAVLRYPKSDDTPALNSWVGALAMFVVVSGVLWFLNQRQEKVEQEAALEQVDASTENIVHAPEEERKPFKGRYVYGSDPAALRVVAFIDYECSLCREVEMRLMRLAKERSDLALSIKHHPMCSDCNSFVRDLGKNPHPNACRAAQAVEAAGLLDGEDAYWELHEWIVGMRGKFTDEELKAHLVENGVEPNQFMAFMNRPRTKALVEQDVEEGIAIGVNYTPMIFINGVELKGIQGGDMIDKAIEKIAAGKPVPKSWAEAIDKPLSAGQRMLSDWLNAPEAEILPDIAPWAMNSAEGEIKADIVVFGDYRHPLTVQADVSCRRIMQEQKPGVRYSFRPFPVDRTCNPNVPEGRNSGGCHVAAAVEAVGRMSGPQAYWNMHDRMMANYNSQNSSYVIENVTALGVDAFLFQQKMTDLAVQDAVNNDIEAGGRLKLTGLPAIYINNRPVSRWRDGKQSVINVFVDHLLQSPE